LQKKNTQLFWLGPDLWWGTVYPEVFEQYYGIPGSRVQELLDFPYGKHLTLDEAEELVERLDHLCPHGFRIALFRGHQVAGADPPLQDSHPIYLPGHGCHRSNASLALDAGARSGTLTLPQ
jgi:hypothetical protein